MTSILFYVEPMPIRNTYTSFKHVPKLFSKFILETPKKYKPIIYSNYQTLDSLAIDNKEFSNYYEFPTCEEQKFFESLFCDWETEGINLWLELYKNSELCKKFIDIIDNIYKRNRFDYIVCWGTNLAVRKFAEVKQIGFINLELGCSRAPYIDSIVGDHMGVNGDSFLSHCHIDDIPYIEMEHESYDLYYSMNLNSKGYEERFSYIQDNLINIDYSKYNTIFLIILQLSDDANMLQYSKFNNIKNFLETVLPQINKNSLCIIKEHPLSKNRISSVNENYIAKKYASRFSNVVWLSCINNSMTNPELLTLCDCVITINSSLGFEALLYEKPVIVYGDAVYKLDGIFPTLEEYQTGEFDYNSYKLKIAKLRSFFLKYYLVNKSSLNDTNFVYKYLTYIGSISKKKDISKSEILYEYIKFRSENDSQF